MKCQGCGEERPAEVFPVWTFIAEELEERKMSHDDLLGLMGGNKDENEMFLTSDPPIRLSAAVAERLERALGVSAATWINLDMSWRRHQHKAGETSA